MPDNDEALSMIETVLVQLLGFSARKSRRSTPRGHRRHRRRSSTSTPRSSASSTVLRSLGRTRSRLLSAAAATRRHLVGRHSRRERIHMFCRTQLTLICHATDAT